MDRKIHFHRRLELRGEPSDPVMAELQFYPGRLQNLVYLTVSHFKISINISSHGSEPLFPRLQELTITCCDGCSELTWLGRLPCLEKLTITDCRGLREVLLLHEGGHDHAIPKADIRVSPESSVIDEHQHVPIAFSIFELAYCARMPPVETTSVRTPEWQEFSRFPHVGGGEHFPLLSLFDPFFGYMFMA
ncbi:hypothetical protein Taro_037468 [Colocasia esculenta]|uniref:Uncharacterized protein n=1 Tax=Colocasia esculenta TaxID=4460 RepID=A0A843WJD5_COLES|nr:hypothetical protein [Colocasia esculenta]